MSRWSSNATWQGPNTTWRTLFALFWAVLVPLRWSHVVLEAQRDMAGAQYDVALAFGSLLGCFGAFGMEPRRVGGPTRHGALPIRRDARFWLLFGLFWCLWDGATSRWRSNATWRGPSQSCTAFFWALQHIKSHLRTRSEVAGFTLIWFLVCLTCQLGH